MIISIAAVVVVIVAIIITWFFATSRQKKFFASTVGTAEERSREIIDEALKTAETKKREALLEAKEENLKGRNELEKEIKERRNELSRLEKRALNKEETLDRKTDALEKREAGLSAKEEKLNQKHSRADELTLKATQELERISGLTSEQAKEFLLKSVEDEVKYDTAKLVKELEYKAKEEAAKKAQINLIKRKEGGNTVISQIVQRRTEEIRTIAENPILSSIDKNDLFVQEQEEEYKPKKKFLTDSMFPHLNKNERKLLSETLEKIFFIIQNSSDINKKTAENLINRIKDELK
jgi:hypothetical protein